MQKLSTTGFGKARFWALAFGVSVAMLMLVAPILAASYALTVQTDKSSYSGSDTIHITGKVTPAPGPNTAVFVAVSNPNGKNVDFGSEAVDPTTGAYSHTTVAGGGGPLAPLWYSGTYTVNASWGASGTVISQATTFAYTAATTTTTTTSSSTTSTTTTSTTTTTTTTSTHSTTTSTSTSTSSTTTSTSSTIPEFNPEALLIVSLVALAAIAVVGRTRLSKGPPVGI